MMIPTIFGLWGIYRIVIHIRAYSLHISAGFLWSLVDTINSVLTLLERLWLSQHFTMSSPCWAAIMRIWRCKRENWLPNTLPNGILLYVCLCGMVTVCLSVWYSVCLSVCLSMWYSVCLSVGLFVCLSNMYDTVYVVSFDGQNFRGFRSFKVNCENFPTKN